MKPLFAILPLSIAILSSCSKSENQLPADDGLNLTVPVASRSASNYCGPTTPETPEDPTPAYTFDAAFIDSKLKGEGLLGWMHGIVPSYQHYTFTYRLEDPSDFMAFFKAQQFTLIPKSEDVAKQLPTLHRHDKVRLKGSVFNNGSPIPHLFVESIEVVTPFAAPTQNEYQFDMNQFKDLKKLELFGQLHAKVYSEKLGYGLIVEHKDALFPIAVSPEHASVAAKMFRSDIVNISLKVVESPRSPAHFVTDPDVANAIDVIDPMLNCHKQARTVEGFLVKFRKSPAISSDTYGVRVVDSNGIARNFTLFPGDHGGNDVMQLFKDLAVKAKDAWDASPETEIVVRNYHAKKGIWVKATGFLNVESPDQANPQVYIGKVDDLVFETK
jgi:hypothetical protein